MRAARSATAVRVEEWVQPHQLLRASRAPAPRAEPEQRSKAASPRPSPIKDAIIRWLEQEL